MNMPMPTRAAIAPAAPYRARLTAALAGEWWNGRGFVVLATIASMLPLIGLAVPPLVDLPGHIGRYRVMLGTDAAILDRWYSFHWHLVGNLGVDLIVRVLAPLIGLEPSVKAVVLALPPLTVLGTLWIAREVHGRIHPFALFALPLVYCFPFQFGFVNYQLSMALALNAFALWLAMGRLGLRRARAAVFVPISLILWLCHLTGWGAFGVLVFSAELMRAHDRGAPWPRAVANAVAACLPLSLPFILLVVWRSSGSGGEVTDWGRWDLKLSWLAMILRDRWMLFDIATTAIIYLVLYKGVRDRRVRYSRNLAISAGFLFVVFAILPLRVFGSAYADMRLAPFVVLLALVSLKPGAGVGLRELRLLAIGGTALFAARVAGTAVSFLEYDRGIRQELGALDHLPRGARVVTLIGSTCAENWSQSRLYHLPGLALARRAVYSNDQWALAGAPLLSVHAPEFGRFVEDPSQLVLSAPCRQDPNRHTIAESLAQIPYRNLDYLWLVDPPAYDPHALPAATPVWRDGTSVLYRIEHRARR